MQNVIKVNWRNVQNGRVLLGAGRVLGTVTKNEQDHNYSADVNRAGVFKHLGRFAFEHDAIATVNREFGVIEIE